MLQRHGPVVVTRRFGEQVLIDGGNSCDTRQSYARMSFQKARTLKLLRRTSGLPSASAWLSAPFPDMCAGERHE